jgi:hypothetical protein
MALGSTSALFNEHSKLRIRESFQTILDESNPHDYDLLFIRMLGAMCNLRAESCGQDSNTIRDMLYSNINVHETEINAAVISAIGNLRDQIDSHGESIIVANLNHPKEIVRLASASAIDRIPFRSNNTDLIISKISAERNESVKKYLTSSLAKSSKNNIKTKRFLLDSLDDRLLAIDVLSAIEEIKYDLTDSDVELLEAKLSNETKVENQRALARLILRSRQN